MKICGLIMSNFDSDKVDFDIKSSQNSQHQFTFKIITKVTTEAELDEICERNDDNDFDYFWVLPSTAPLTDEDIEKFKYLEVKQIPLLGPTSKLLSMTMKSLDDFEKFIPDGIQIEKSSNEDGILGVEIVVIVVETLTDVMALSPVIFLDGNARKNSNSTANGMNGTHPPSVEEEIEFYHNGSGSNESMATEEMVKNAALDIYKAMGVTGSGYAKFHFYLTSKKEIYLRKVVPLLLSMAGDTNFEDDCTINSVFPGGLPAFIETVTKAKQRTDTILRHYKDAHKDYDTNIQSIAQYTPAFQKLVSMYNFEGTILDLGCGTGHLETIIHAKYPSAVMTGVDICEEMTQCAKGYANFKIGKVENVIMEETSNYDHIVAAGIFPFVDTTNFLKVLSRMFCLAKSSISMSIEDYAEDYNDNHSGQGDWMFVFNHRKTMEAFNIPQEWTLKSKEKIHAWCSSEDGTRLDGFLYHFEKTGN